VEALSREDLTVDWRPGLEQGARGTFTVIGAHRGDLQFKSRVFAV